jgi:hypothetical protein
MRKKFYYNVGAYFLRMDQDAAEPALRHRSGPCHKAGHGFVPFAPPREAVAGIARHRVTKGDTDPP